MPAHLRRGLTVHLVETVDEVLALALLPPPEPKPQPGTKTPQRPFPGRPRRPATVASRDRPSARARRAGPRSEATAPREDSGSRGGMARRTDSPERRWAGAPAGSLARAKPEAVRSDADCDRADHRLAMSRSSTLSPRDGTAASAGGGPPLRRAPRRQPSRSRAAGPAAARRTPATTPESTRTPAPHRAGRARPRPRARAFARARALARAGAVAGVREEVPQAGDQERPDAALPGL